MSLKPFKHAPSIDISTWYKSILITQLATAEETGGAFDLVLGNMRSESPIFSGSVVASSRGAVLLPMGDTLTNGHLCTLTSRLRHVFNDLQGSVASKSVSGC
jgi:hypothetical protein